MMFVGPPIAPIEYVIGVFVYPANESSNAILGPLRVASQVIATITSSAPAMSHLFLRPGMSYVAPSRGPVNHLPLNFRATPLSPTPFLIYNSYRLTSTLDTDS